MPYEGEGVGVVHLGVGVWQVTRGPDFCTGSPTGRAVKGKEVWHLNGVSKGFALLR